MKRILLALLTCILYAPAAGHCQAAKPFIHPTLITGLLIAGFGGAASAIAVGKRRSKDLAKTKKERNEATNDCDSRGQAIDALDGMHSGRPHPLFEDWKHKESLLANVRYQISLLENPSVTLITNMEKGGPVERETSNQGFHNTIGLIRAYAHANRELAELAFRIATPLQNCERHIQSPNHRDNCSQARDNCEILKQYVPEMLSIVDETIGVLEREANVPRKLELSVQRANYLRAQNQLKKLNAPLKRKRNIVIAATITSAATIGAAWWLLSRKK